MKVIYDHDLTETAWRKYLAWLKAIFPLVFLGPFFLVSELWVSAAIQVSVYPQDKDFVFQLILLYGLLPAFAVLTISALLLSTKLSQIFKHKKLKRWQLLVGFAVFTLGLNFVNLAFLASGDTFTS